MAYKVNHIHVRCEDVEKSIKFYVDVLGGEITATSEVRGMPITRVRLGDVNLALSPAAHGVKVDRPAEENTWGVYHLGFEVDDIQAEFERLSAAGVEFALEPYAASEKMTIAFFKAPDGLQFELMELK